MSETIALSPEQFIFANGEELRTTSLKIADAFEKRHSDVLRAIEKITTQVSDSFNKRNFALTQVDTIMPTGGVRKDPGYELTKDGFMIVVMSFTGEKAMAIKEWYINAFNTMYDKLHKESSKTADKQEYLFPNFDEVLRKQESPQIEKDVQTSSGILEITSNFLALAKLLGRVGEEAVTGADNATYKLCGYSPLDYLASNKSAIYTKTSVEPIVPKDTLTREQYVTATTIGNEVGRNAIAVNLRLYDMGFLNAVPNGFTKRGKPKSIYVLTEEGKKYGKLMKVQSREGDEFEQIKWSKEAVVPLVRKAFEGEIRKIA